MRVGPEGRARNMAAKGRAAGGAAGVVVVVVGPRREAVAVDPAKGCWWCRER